MSGKTPDKSSAGKREGSNSEDAPAWAEGLKQLYDSVIEEPLPDSFKHLLDQFDADDAGEGPSDCGPAE